MNSVNKQRLSTVATRAVLAGFIAIAMVAVSLGGGRSAEAYSGQVGAHDTAYVEGNYGFNVMCTSGSGIAVWTPRIFAVSRTPFMEKQHVAWRPHLYKYSTKTGWTELTSAPAAWHLTSSGLAWPASDTEPAHFNEYSQFADFGAGWYAVEYEFAWFDNPVDWGSVIPAPRVVTGYDRFFKTDTYGETTSGSGYITIGGTPRTGMCYMAY